jgi:hypothetical protein
MPPVHRLAAILTADQSEAWNFPEVGFASGSRVEGDGFEPSVPGATKREIARSFRSDRGPYRRREAPDPQHPQRGR